MTTPAPAARTGSPAKPARSTPRCPGSHGCGGGANGRVTRSGPSTGDRHPTATTNDAGGRDEGSTALDGSTAKSTTVDRRTRAITGTPSLDGGGQRRAGRQSVDKKLTCGQPTRRTG